MALTQYESKMVAGLCEHLDKIYNTIAENYESTRLTLGKLSYFTEMEDIIYSRLYNNMIDKIMTYRQKLQTYDYRTRFEFHVVQYYACIGVVNGIIDFINYFVESVFKNHDPNWNSETYVPLDHVDPLDGIPQTMAWYREDLKKRESAEKGLESVMSGLVRERHEFTRLEANPETCTHTYNGKTTWRVQPVGNGAKLEKVCSLCGLRKELNE